MSAVALTFDFDFTVHHKADVLPCGEFFLNELFGIPVKIGIFASIIEYRLLGLFGFDSERGGM